MATDKYLLSYVDCFIRNIPMVDCYIKLYPLPLHLSYLPIPPLIVVYYIAILRHRICHHIPLLHICWLLICYFDTCILIINPYSIHNNYLSSCKIAKLQLQNVSSLLHHFDKLLHWTAPPQLNIGSIVAFAYQYTTDSAAPPDHYREAEARHLLSQQCLLMPPMHYDNLQADKLRHGYLLITVTGSYLF
jgi:hypothetical protein